MRIIAGNLKGKRLISPKTEKIRPTLDRVKEAIFSMLTPYLTESRVLDLFAGSGSVGLECISRGAKYCVLNDKEKSAISTIFENVELTNTYKYVKISMKDYMKCIKKMELEEQSFDIIFLDPPYNSSFALEVLQYLSDHPGKVLAKDGIVVFETDKTYLQDTYDNIENLECIVTKFYSRVAVKIYRWRN